MTMNQELRQAAVLQQAREALQMLVDEKVDYMLRNHLGNPEREHATKAGRAALSALSAVLEKQDSSHLAAPTDEARSGSGVPARPALPGEDERFEAWWDSVTDDGALYDLVRGKEGPEDAAWAVWQAALAASPLPQARMLTGLEVRKLDGNLAADEHTRRHTEHIASRAIAKFCEVNGIAIAGTQGEQKP